MAFAETSKHPGVSTNDVSTRRVVLIVEDDAWIQGILGELLEDEGFEIVSTSDGESGLKTAERLRPDLILLDVGLPRMGGEEFLEHLRARRLLPRLPVVVISGSADMLSQKIRELADCVLRKPFDVALLLDVAHAHTRPASGASSFTPRAGIHPAVGAP